MKGDRMKLNKDKLRDILFLVSSSWFVVRLAQVGATDGVLMILLQLFVVVALMIAYALEGKGGVLYTYTFVFDGGGGVLEGVINHTSDHKLTDWEIYKKEKEYRVKSGCKYVWLVGCVEVGA